MTPSHAYGSYRHLERRFVQQTDTDDGIAWCIRARGGTAVLRYTEIPEEIEEVREVPIKCVRPIELPYRSRAWLPSHPFGWIPAEVVGRLAHGHYLVRVTGMGDLPVRPDQIRIRWNRPLTDPSSAVGHGLVEGREYYDARQPFLRNVVQQRAMYKGFTAAASAAVLPFQHQLNVLSRVTGDPVMRFILADEVGLGKTIEAGLVIRQILLDDPKANIAVVVPDFLVGQWISELSDRLALGPLLTRTFVAPYDAVADVTARKPTMLVVDEAHRMIETARGDARLDQNLTLAAHSIPGLLLLTATPMHGGVEGFLRLLNLIDPWVYSLDEIESFGRRLKMRHEQASQIELLRPGIPTSLILSVLDNFTKEYGTDMLLRPLLERARSSMREDSLDRGVHLRAVADHLRETYRISRRVIRHRRHAAQTRGYPVSGRRPKGIELDDPTRSLLDGFLDEWRLHLLSISDRPATRALFFLGAWHVLAGPGPTLEFIHFRLNGELGQRVMLDSTENALLRNTAAGLELCGIRTRINLVTEFVAAAARPGRKILVFTSFTSQAHILAETLRHKGTSGSVALHTVDMPPDARDYDVDKFLYEPGFSVLIADDSAAEGRNFQMVDELVNLDLPLSANALEQRIGRVDRFNLHAKPTGTLCSYLVEPGSAWIARLLYFLKDVAGVFNQSVATFQQSMETMENTIHEQLLRRGHEALNIPREAVRDSLAEEREQLDLLGEIEDAQLFSDFSDASFDDLLKFEDKSESLKDAFRQLMRPHGGIGLQSRRAARFAEIFEFRLSGDRNKVQGLSLNEYSAIQPVLAGRRAFDKIVAATQPDVKPIRIGDPLVDWLDGYLRNDERGRSVALLRRVRHIVRSQLWLGFDYLLQFDDSALAADVDRQRLRRRGDAFLNPRVETVWTDGVSEAPNELLPLLSEPAGNQLIIEQPLRGRAWKQVLSRFPDWTERCRKAAALSAEIIRSRPAVMTAADEGAELAEAENVRRSRVMRARAMLYPDGREREQASADLAHETALAEQVARGVRDPKVELLACVAVVLMPPDN